MEKQHKDLINNNFEFLLDKCKSDLLLSKLRTKIPFLPEEYDNLIGIKDRRKQCRELFTLLMTRGPNVYDAIISALIESNQYLVLNKLKPGACDAPDIAIQRTEQQRNQKVFIEPQTYCIASEINSIGSQENLLEVLVKKSSNFDYEQIELQLGNPLYNTTSKNRGFVKIVNMFKVHGMKDRVASDVDVENLTALFTQIGCVVDVHNNEHIPPTRENVLYALKEFVNDSRLTDADMAMIFMMSHGGRKDERDFVFDCNGREIYYREIEDFFSNNKCVHMQDKPKMIFIQACRGEMPDYGVKRRVETDSYVVGNTVDIQYMPSQSDLLLAHSTCPGFASLRDTHVGTWFIYLICKVFMNHAHEKDVESMLRIVLHELRYERTPSGEMQTGETTQKTFKKCYLNPGIYREKNEICFF